MKRDSGSPPAAAWRARVCLLKRFALRLALKKPPGATLGRSAPRAIRTASFLPNRLASSSPPAVAILRGSNTSTSSPIARAASPSTLVVDAQLHARSGQNWPPSAATNSRRHDFSVGSASIPGLQIAVHSYALPSKGRIPTTRWRRWGQTRVPSPLEPQVVPAQVERAAL